MLVGGGEEVGNWRQEAYSWFVQQADSGIIINVDWSSVDTSYASYFISLGADPASHSLLIPTRPAAQDSNIYYELISASGIFLEDASQWQYVVRWRETLVTEAIEYVFEHGGAIGGIGGGAAVLGDVILEARNGYPSPDSVAYDPYLSTVTFTDDFLNILPNVYPEPNFNSEGRLGSLVPILARRVQDFGDYSLIGVGIEQETAFCVTPDLNGTVFGETVTIVSPDYYSYVECDTAQPPTFRDIHFHQLLQHAVFNLDNRSLVDPGYYLDPVFTPLPPIPDYQAISINGSDDNSRYYGEIVITNLTSQPLAWWQGLLGQATGDAIVPHSIIIPELWEDPDYFANRISGGYWGLATNDYFVTIYLDDNCYVNIEDSGLLTVGTLAYILSGISASYSGVNAYWLPGLYDARLHFLGDGDSLRLDSLFVGIMDEKDNDPLPHKTGLLLNYPNPFNTETRIRFKVSTPADVSLRIYNVQGGLVDELFNQTVIPGRYYVDWRPESVNSGIYFCQLRTDNLMDIIKLIYLK